MIPLYTFAGTNAMKAASSLIYAEAVTFRDSAQTPLNFYLEMKREFFQQVVQIKTNIEDAIKAIDERMAYLNMNDPAVITDETVRDPAFFLEEEVKIYAQGIPEVNKVLNAISSLINSAEDKISKLSMRGDAQDIMERNLYRDFIQEEFQSKGKYWTVVCHSKIFRPRLIKLGALSEEDFVDDGVFLGIDVWPDAWKGDMNKLFKFAVSALENPLQ